MESAKLKDICERITVGHVGSMRDEYVEEGIPFLRSQNIQPFKLDLEGIKFITPEFHAKLKKSALKPLDVAIVRTGYPGTACVIPKELPVSNCSDLVIITPDADKLDPFYLAAVFNSSWGKATVSGNLVGAAQQHFNVGAAKEMKVNLPPLPSQRKIAGILSAYDDLIENNLRRIKILEDMAQSLYREWFVHFRFPGHASTKMIDSSLGPVPEGWEVKKLKEFGLVVTGKTPSKKKAEYYGSDVPFLKTPDMHSQMFIQHTTEALSDEGAATQSNKTLPVNSICVSCIGTVGVVSITTEPCQTNQQINSVVIHNKDCREFLYLQIKSLKKTLENLGSTGATMTNVNKGKFEGMDVLSPCEATLQDYSRLVAPMFDSIRSLQKKNQNLRQTRDLILPKLLTP